MDYTALSENFLANLVTGQATGAGGLVTNVEQVVPAVAFGLASLGDQTSTEQDSINLLVPVVAGAILSSVQYSADDLPGGLAIDDTGKISGTLAPVRWRLRSHGPCHGRD